MAALEGEQEQFKPGDVRYDRVVDELTSDESLKSYPREDVEQHVEVFSDLGDTDKEIIVIWNYLEHQRNYTRDLGVAVRHILAALILVDLLGTHQRPPAVVAAAPSPPPPPSPPCQSQAPPAADSQAVMRSYEEALCAARAEERAAAQLQLGTATARLLARTTAAEQRANEAQRLLAHAYRDDIAPKQLALQHQLERQQMVAQQQEAQKAQISAQQQQVAGLHRHVDEQQKQQLLVAESQRRVEQQQQWMAQQQWAVQQQQNLKAQQQVAVQQQLNQQAQQQQAVQDQQQGVTQQQSVQAQAFVDRLFA